MSDVSAETRERLAVVADALIPAAHGMPAASAVGVATDQLDVVLRSRPDILEALERGLAVDAVDPMALLADLESSDRDAHDAILLAVVAGYYMHPEIHELIGYPGQVPLDVARIGEREMFEEGLAEMLAEAGAQDPVYRPTPDQSH